MDYNSTTGPIKPEFKFDENFIEFINQSLNSYSELMNLLHTIISHPSDVIDETYGICNNGYAVRFIKPYDISTYVSYIVKAVVSNTIKVNINDLELLSASLVRQFIVDNGCVPIENGVIYSRGIAMTDRNETLDDLVVKCSNEWFETSVLSKADMLARIPAMKEHVATMEKLNFAVNVRKLMVGIPRIINENSDFYCDKTIVAVLEEFIKKFISTAVAINLFTLKQMIGYCIPNTGYNIKKIQKDPNKRMDYDFYGDNCIKLTDGFCTETVDTERYSPVFVVLSKGTTPIVSPGIRFFSGGDYSHASISFDKDLHTMYTFNGGVGVDDIYPEKDPGMQKESLQGTKFKDNEVVIYVLFIKNDIVSQMIDTCEDMYQKKEAKYSYKMIVDKLFHRDNAPKDGRFICSSFVNTIISMCGEKLVDKNIPSPHEMSEKAKTMPDRCLKLYTGKGGDFNFHDAIETIQDFVDEDDSKPFVESYYTECDLFKTNEMRIHSQIPFNCNMRDIVLQDMHPEFKDTMSAIKFMMNDSRSPIAKYVRKYATEQFRDNYYGTRILHMFMHFKPSDKITPFDRPRSADEVRNSLGMHTDVNWLDKITYGNEFLDGNYRADAVGNNHFSPIEVTLDTLYKMYSVCGKKTNEEIANNVVTVSCAMMDVINSFVAERPDNWEVVRDILAVLGEILTRSMLKLYHNNTMICVVTDDMPDAGGPGYMYEYALLEAQGASVEVQVKNASGTMDKAKLNVKTIMNKFVDWCKRVYATVANKFTKNHAAELKWIKSNEGLNNEIATALNGDNFAINLTNAPNYNIKVNEIKDIQVETLVKNCIEGSREIPKNDIEFIAEAGPEKMKPIIQNLGEGTTVAAAQEAVQNFILYGSTSPENPTISGKCSGPYFENLVSNITNAGEALKAVCDDNSKKLEAAAKLITDKSGKVQTSKGDETLTGGKPAAESMHIDLDGRLFMEEDNDASSGNDSDGSDDKGINEEKLAQLGTMLGKFTNVYSTAFVNVMQKKVFGESYKLYQQIVTGYKQVKGQIKPAAQNANTQQEQKPAETPQNPTPAEGATPATPT